MSAIVPPAMFSLADLSPFERHGATVTPRDETTYSAGCHVALPNGWTVSIMWGNGNYSDNYSHAPDAPPADSTTAEIAVFSAEDGMVQWMDGDTVQGYCSLERVLNVIDLVAEGKLMRDYHPPVEVRADDGHVS